MDRMTIEDVRIDKDTIRRTIIDAEKVKECAMEFYWRLKAIEDVIADEERKRYDLDRLKVLVNQCMTMREEVAERFSITKDIPVDTLREMVNSPYWMSPVCVGCPGKMEDGHRTQKCGYPDDMTLCEERQKRLFELVDADREGRCVVLPKDGMVYYIEEARGEKWISNKPIQQITVKCGWGIASIEFSLLDAGKYFTREAAEIALKGEQDG